MNPYIVAQLKRDEDVRRFPYRDTVGKLTIGVGRNLEDVGLSADEIEYLLGNDLKRVEAEARKFPWFAGLDEVRQSVVLNMLFNLGETKFRGFANTIKAIESGDYHGAARRMLQSKWARQVGNRAVRLAAMMRTGVVQ